MECFKPTRLIYTRMYVCVCVVLSRGGEKQFNYRSTKIVGNRVRIFPRLKKNNRSRINAKLDVTNLYIIFFPISRYCVHTRRVYNLLLRRDNPRRVRTDRVITFCNYFRGSLVRLQ